MKNDINYYVGGRNPYRGGLGILETNQEFPSEYKERISNESLELISHTDEMLPLAIFPVDYTHTSIAMTMRIKGSKVEKRPHEVIHGITVSDMELKRFCQYSLAEEEIDEYFFPVKADMLEELGAWKPNNNPISGNRVELFWKAMDQAQILGFFWAVMDVIRSRKKVQLIVPEGTERVVQAACYSVLPKSQICNLSTISCGECTVAEADILITKHIDFQDSRKYRLMTLTEFINSGNMICEKNEHNNRTKAVEKIVENCLSYITNYEMSDYDLAEIRREMHLKSYEDYHAFQSNLKIGLSKLKVKKEHIRRFVKVLYIAYEMNGEHRRWNDIPIMSAPYDMEGIVKFIKKYTETERRFRKFLMEVVGVQNEYFDSFLTKKENTKVNKVTVNKITNYFK